MSSNSSPEKRGDVGSKSAHRPGYSDTRPEHTELAVSVLCDHMYCLCYRMECRWCDERNPDDSHKCKGKTKYLRERKKKR